jgi:hypothetical protein
VQRLKTENVCILLLLGNLQDNYTAPRIVLAASGVDHKELLTVAEPLLSDLPSVSPHRDEVNSVYTGGDYRAVADTPVEADDSLSPYLIQACIMLKTLADFT